MECFAFYTVVATIEATASFKHLRFALCKTTSERTLSENKGGTGPPQKKKIEQLAPVSSQYFQ